MSELTKNENLKYQLETLAAYEPVDIDSPEFDVAYENESGAEGMTTVCCIDLAAKSLRRIEELEAALSQQEAGPVAFDDWPEYHEQGMGCGLEDRGITDRYEAMRYGWDEAIDRVAESFAQFETPKPAPLPQRCEYCDGTGDVHGFDGEWRGECTACNKQELPQPVAQIVESLADGGMDVRWNPEYSLNIGEYLYSGPPKPAPLPQPEKCEICGSGIVNKETAHHPETRDEVDISTCPACELSYYREDEQPVASVPQGLEEAWDALDYVMSVVIGRTNYDHHQWGDINDALETISKAIAASQEGV